MRASVKLTVVGMVVAGVAGCNEQSAEHPASASAATASAPGFTRTATAQATPDTSAATDTAAAAPDDAAGGAAASDELASDVPLPEVDIKTIGMHIGGGPNDKKTKAPIRRAVEAEIDDFKACFAKADDPSKGGTFGVDIRIPGTGGKAKISAPRLGLDGRGVKECMVQAFEGVEFDKPAKGVDMMVSYSIRFTPKGT